jgi:hypothetical protein
VREHKLYARIDTGDVMNKSVRSIFFSKMRFYMLEMFGILHIYKLHYPDMSGLINNFPLRLRKKPEGVYRQGILSVLLCLH